MYANIPLLDFVFRLTLFGLLVYKLYSLIKQYAVPELYEAIESEKKHHTEILEKEKLLVSTKHRIENQITTQKKMFILLEKKLALLHEAMLAKNAALEEEQKSTVQKLNDKRGVQKKYLALAKNTQNSVPLALNEAKALLMTNYGNHQGEVLLKKLISELSQTM